MIICWCRVGIGVLYLHICVTPTSRFVNLYKLVSLYYFYTYSNSMIIFCLVMSKGSLVTETTPKDLTFKSKKGIYKL